MTRERMGTILQHDPAGPADLFADWLAARGIPFEVRRVWEDGAPDDPAESAWICSLGSEATPGAPGAPSWVDEEVGFLRRALAVDVPVLGLCFGGQALAAAAGGSVHPAEPAEVGWLAIETGDPELIPAGPWLYFHYDQLELPDGATEIARSPAGTAAFTLGRHLGLQFHPETSPEIAAGWVEAERGRLEQLGIDARAIAADGERLGEGGRAAAFELFDAWWSRLNLAT